MKNHEEIEKFFTAAQQIIFSPRQNGSDGNKNEPSVTLIFKEETIKGYSKDGIIPKAIEDLTVKKPILLIDPLDKLIQFSIADGEGKNLIPIPNAKYDLSFPDFLQKTRWYEKIFLTIASVDPTVSAFSGDLKDNLFLILHGYSFAA